jgi:hypothetical protein
MRIRENQELYHGFLGEMLKNHKYIAREENDSSHKNKYTYFYTEEAHEAFKKARDNVASKAISVANTIQKRVYEFNKFI